jgi:hypothetical protein
MNCRLCRYQQSNCHKAYPTRLKKFSTGDWLTARKTDAPAASAGYEVLYHRFNGSDSVPEAFVPKAGRLVYPIICNRELSRYPEKVL